MPDCTLHPHETHLRKCYANTTVLLRGTSGMAWTSAYNPHHTSTCGALEAPGRASPPEPGKGGRAETPQAQAEGTRRAPWSRRAPAPAQGRTAAQHDQKRTGAACTLLRWPKADGGGHKKFRQGARVGRRRPALHNKSLELTASSVRSCLASASGSSSGLALGVATNQLTACKENIMATVTMSQVTELVLCQISIDG